MLPGNLLRYGILMYKRFADDICIVAEATATLLRDFLVHVRQLAKFFVLGVDHVSPFGVVMLDLVLLKGDGFDKSGFLNKRYAIYGSFL